MPNLPPRPGWKHWLPRLPRDVGKREQMLLMLGFIWFMIGLSRFVSSGSGSIFLLHDHIPSDWRALGWILSGLGAMAAALRPPSMQDTFGWVLLYVMPTMRVVSYLLAWAASWDWLPLENTTLTDAYADGWRFAAIYLAQSLTVVICAGWPNPMQPLPDPQAEEVADER